MKKNIIFGFYTPRYLLHRIFIGLKTSEKFLKAVLYSTDKNLYVVLNSQKSNNGYKTDKSFDKSQKGKIEITHFSKIKNNRIKMQQEIFQRTEHNFPLHLLLIISASICVTGIKTSFVHIFIYRV